MIAAQTARAGFLRVIGAAPTARAALAVRSCSRPREAAPAAEKAP